MKLRSVIAAAVSAVLCAAPATIASTRAEALTTSVPGTPPIQLTFASNVPLLGSNQDDAHDHAHGPGHSHVDEMLHLQPGLEANLFEGWLDPWQHSDYSRLGSPFVHLFLSEPAYIDRGIHLDFGFTTGDEGEEYEVEAELELGLTRRIGLVIEAPYELLDPEEGESENGFGDIAIAPRLLLLDYDRFLLSANLEFEFPTGDEDRGLGAGEAIFAPSLSTWIDLGHNISVQGNLGLEHGFKSDFDVLTWGAALSYTMYLRDAEIVSADGAVRSHFPVGTLSLIGELRGEHPLDGDDEGIGTATAVLGASYTFAPLLDFRAGVTFAPWKPREFDVGAIFGFIYHF